MPITVIPTRVDGVDANAADDTNDLMSNFQNDQFYIDEVTGNISFGSTTILANNKMQIIGGAAGGITYLNIGNQLVFDNQFIRLGINNNTAEIGYDNADTFALGVYSDATSSGLDATFMTMDTSGDAWFIGDVSALTFTDRTPFFEGDAIKEIKKIKGKNGEIDHSTLPKFARATRIKKEIIDDKEVETTEELRDIGALLSMDTVAIQQIVKRLEALEK